MGLAVVPTVAGIDAGFLSKRFLFVLVCLMYEAQVVQVFVSCSVEAVPQAVKVRGIQPEGM